MTVDAKLPKVHVKNSIFFLHTSAEKEISNIARCTIESAARYNPSTRIIVYSNAWNEDDTIIRRLNIIIISYFFVILRQIVYLWIITERIC